MKDIEIKIINEALEIVKPEKILYIGDAGIRDYREIQFILDKRGINETPENTKHLFSLLGYDKVDIFNENEIDNLPAETYDLVINAFASSTYFDQVKFFGSLIVRTHVGGYQCHIVPFMTTIDNEFFSYSPSFFPYLGSFNNLTIEKSWLGNYFLTKFYEFDIEREFQGINYERTLGINFLQNDNWTSHIALGVILKRHEKEASKGSEDVQKDD